jgi:hypothetical protein
MKVIYILCQQDVPILFSPNRKDLVDYTLKQSIEGSIIELPLVPSPQELAKFWVKVLKQITI